jgi:hypothetical protein
MNKFWQLLKESVIIQGTVTLALVGAVVYLSCANQEVPDVLSAACTLALGYYFGSKAQQTIAARGGS